MCVCVCVYGNQANLNTADVRAFVEVCEPMHAYIIYMCVSYIYVYIYTYVFVFIYNRNVCTATRRT